MKWMNFLPMLIFILGFLFLGFYREKNWLALKMHRQLDKGEQDYFKAESTAFTKLLMLGGLFFFVLGCILCI